MEDVIIDDKCCTLVNLKLLKSANYIKVSYRPFI